jgi:PKD repeat protein
LVQLDAMPCPTGVSAETWAALTDALREALAKQGQVPRAKGQGKATSALALEPPHGDAAASVLVYSADGALLNWGYFSPGDYDQNGEVGLSDLVPLAVHFGESTGTGSPFPENSIQAVIDGDGNGELNLGDIIAIAANFGVHTEGYRVYCAAAAAAYPPSPDSPNGAGTVCIGGVAFGDAVEPPGGGRKGFNYQVVPTEYGLCYWARPFDGETDGAASNYVLVALPPKRAPVAKLAYPPTAETLAHIVWNADASFDPDGVITRYEWDFNDDGVYEYDSGQVPTADFYYYAPGEYACTVRVTDGDFLTATASGQVIVSEKAKWHVKVVAERTKDESGMPVETGVPLSLMDAAGHPALVYVWRLTVQDPLTKGMYGLHYVRAEDTQGEAWPQPVLLSGMAGASMNEGFRGAAAIVQGNPAVSYTYVERDEDSQPVRSVLAYQRANDAAGSEWGQRVIVDVGQIASYTPPECMMIVGGGPAVAAGYYCRTSNPTGGTWPAPHDTAASDKLVVVGGAPCYCTRINMRDLTYVRGLDFEALSWAQLSLVDQLEKVGENYSLLEVGGHPAVVYFDDSLDGLKYRRASDADGLLWDSMTVLSAEADGQLNAAIVDGRPAVLYGDRIGKEFFFVAANDAEGQRWSGPIAVPIAYDTYLLARVLGYTLPQQLGDIAGLPAIAFASYEQRADSVWVVRLYYVAYY